MAVTCIQRRKEDLGPTCKVAASKVASSISGNAGHHREHCAAFAPSCHTVGCHIDASIGWLGVGVTVSRSVALSSECWPDPEVMTYMVRRLVDSQAVTCQRHSSQTQSAFRSFRTFSPRDLGTISRTLTCGRSGEDCVQGRTTFCWTSKATGQSPEGNPIRSSAFRACRIAQKNAD
jgi:hypothetical protein